MKLSGHHRVTLEKIFGHPLNHSIEWHDVVSLLNSLGAVEHERNGELKVTLAGQSEVLRAPHHGHEDVLDEEQVIDLRRMLQAAGVTPGTTEGTEQPG